MKNIKLIILTMAILLGCQTFTNAIQTPNIETQREINKNSANQLKEKNNDKFSAAFTSIIKLGERYYSNLRTCEQVHVHQYIDIFGLKINFNADINGWVDGKCQYRITGNIASLGKDIRELYDVKFTDEALAKVKPLIACDFTQENLDILVDAIVSRQMKSMEELLTNPAEKQVNISTKTMTPEEEKLYQILSSGTVCTVPNQQETFDNIQELITPYMLVPQTPRTNPQEK